MATAEKMSKMDMIKALIDSNAVAEFKKEKDSSLKLASRMFRTLTSEEVKSLYLSRIAASPEKAVEEVTKKVKKAAKKAKEVKEVKAKEDKIEPKAEILDNKPIVDGDHEYKHIWVLKMLNQYNFSEVRNGSRTVQGKTHRIKFNLDANKLTVYPLNGIRLVNSTPANSECITKCFIEKYLK